MVKMTKVALSSGSSRKKNIIYALNLIDDDIKQVFNRKDGNSVLIKPNMVKTDNIKAKIYR